MDILKIKNWIESDYQFKPYNIDFNGKILLAIRIMDGRPFELGWKKEFKDAGLSWVLEEFKTDYKTVILREDDNGCVSRFAIPINAL